MTDEDRPDHPQCPVCVKPMDHHHTIRCVFAPNLTVFRCDECGLTVSRPERRQREP